MLRTGTISAAVTQILKGVASEALSVRDDIPVPCLLRSGVGADASLAAHFRVYLQVSGADVTVLAGRFGLEPLRALARPCLGRCEVSAAVTQSFILWCP